MEPGAMGAMGATGRVSMARSGVLIPSTRAFYRNIRIIYTYM